MDQPPLGRFASRDLRDPVVTCVQAKGGDHALRVTIPTAPMSVRAAAILVVAYAVLGLAIAGWTLAGSDGRTGIFTASHANEAAAPSTIASAEIVLVVLEIVWRALPVLLIFSITRGSRLSRWGITILAALNLLGILPVISDWAALTPTLALAVVASLLWLPQSSRYLTAQRERVGREKQGPSPFTRL